MRDVLNNIFNALTHLPKPIRRVCYVQLFAFMGWSVTRVLFHQAALTFHQVSVLVLFVRLIFFLARPRSSFHFQNYIYGPDYGVRTKEGAKS